MTATTVPPARAASAPTSSRAFVGDTLLLAFAGLLLRVGLVLAYGSAVPPAADGAFYHVVAQRIAEGAGYTWVWPDGVVTFAAHYPVGYAGLLGGVYALAGSSPVAAMFVNAALGATAVVMTHRLALRGAGRVGGWVAGGLVAFSPTLVGYTLALMTEGAVATGWIGALWLAVRAAEASGAGRQRMLYVLAAGGILGLTMLMRPQSVLLAPVLGWIAGRGALGLRRLGAVLALVGVSMGVCAPWTVRNCVRMDRCVFVSANGGWNLLIGTFPEGQGAWIPIDGERVPEECREVFGEAQKDACFGGAARRRIAERPVEWLGLFPAKWRSTFDFTAAASAYLSEAGVPWDSASQKRLVAVEIAARRSLLALALWGLWRAGRPAAETAWGGRGLRGGRLVVLVGGLVCLFGTTAWASQVALLLLAVSTPRLGQRPLHLATTGALAATLLVHGVFFGAARYSLVLEPFLACAAGLAFAGQPRFSLARALFDTPRRFE